MKLHWLSLHRASLFLGLLGMLHPVLGHSVHTYTSNHCGTHYGTTSRKHLSTSSGTSTMRETVSVTHYHTLTTTSTPKASTSTNVQTSTVSTTVTASQNRECPLVRSRYSLPARVLRKAVHSPYSRSNADCLNQDTFTNTITSTETDTNTIHVTSTETDTATADTTVSSTATVPAAPGFVPIASNPEVIKSQEAKSSMIMQGGKRT